MRLLLLNLSPTVRHQRTWGRPTRRGRRPRTQGRPPPATRAQGPALSPMVRHQRTRGCPTRRGRRPRTRGRPPPTTRAQGPALSPTVRHQWTRGRPTRRGRRLARCLGFRRGPLAMSSLDPSPTTSTNRYTHPFPALPSV
ncbi:hypothetical protein BDA96_02G255200 [Sorghum bicolor]|uniref:Uncharacterized protein n=1 Tax=Sorghum bicolor TaxID=4558 RepID=A0A921RQ76_SORBI|nr:hypothetical protein BDA96_02G255200 [Sorghum bicolor]